MQKQEEFTFTISAEPHPSTLARVLAVFARRHITLECVSVSPDSAAAEAWVTLVARGAPERVSKLTGQLEKLVGVREVSVYPSDQTVFQELALCQVPLAQLAGPQLESLVRTHHARVLGVEGDYAVIEKTGHAGETESLLEVLRPLGTRYVRSGRIALPRPNPRPSGHSREEDRDETRAF